MNRRKILAATATFLGAAALGGVVFLRGALRTPRLPSDPGAHGLSAEDLGLLSDIAEIIVPTTDSPGAGQAEVAGKIADIVATCYSPEAQNAFVAGLRSIDGECIRIFGNRFSSLTRDQQNRFVEGLDRQQRMHARLREAGRRARGVLGGNAWRLVENVIGPDTEPHYFTRLKELVVLTYCMSFPGATLALRYVPVPGRYEGSVQFKPGDRAWAM